MRGSLAILNTGPLSSFWAANSWRREAASAYMERNLYMIKGRPCWPLRNWAKKTGPADVSLIAIATIRNNGDRIRSASVETIKSSIRFRTRDQEASGAE